MRRESQVSPVNFLWQDLNLSRFLHSVFFIYFGARFFQALPISDEVIPCKFAFSFALYLFRKTPKGASTIFLIYTHLLIE